MVSFSITQSDMKEKPYALFGGYNSTQIVDGAKGLKVFKNFKNDLETWALQGQEMTYGNKPFINKQTVVYPAIVDTGSSTLSIPKPIFKKLAAECKKDIPTKGKKKTVTKA